MAFFRFLNKKNILIFFYPAAMREGVLNKLARTGMILLSGNQENLKLLGLVEINPKT